MFFQLKITGQVTIAPHTGLADWTILIIGPTGAGKSTFIEALAGAGHSLRISNDQLEGFTQDVSCHKLENAVLEWFDASISSISLIDTPGFADSNISEMEIINKVKSLINDHRILTVDNILYLTPITDTRVSGSKRRTIKMLQSLLKEGQPSSVTIVTTMWNQVYSTQARERAEAHFGQLGRDVWKDLVRQGAKLVRFQNDQDSAIGILQDAVARTRYNNILSRNPISSSDKSAPLLYQELLVRINNSRQAVEILRIDYLGLISHPDPLLESVVASQLQEAKQTLANFLGQLVQFGIPPPGFEGVPEQVIYQNLLDHVNEAKEEIQALDLALDMSPTTERELALRAKLQVATEDLAEHSEKLVLRGDAPPGFEQALIEALAPPKRLLPPISSPPASDPVTPTAPPSPRHPPPNPMAPTTAAGHTGITPIATPEGSPASRAAFGGRIKKDLKSVRDKIISPFKRGPRH